MGCWQDGERKRVVAAIAVCRVFLTAPDGWEAGDESPKSCWHKPFPAGRPRCSLHSHGQEVRVSAGCDQMHHSENTFSSPEYGHAQLHGARS